MREAVGQGEGASRVRHLLKSWASFVRKVETGYDDTIYDYANDLSARDSLEEALAPLPSPEGEPLRAELRGWDQRFEAATRPSIRPLAPGVTERERSWWFRVPLRPIGELEADLRAEGLIR
jgi:hypothetical protein